MPEDSMETEAMETEEIPLMEDTRYQIFLMKNDQVSYKYKDSKLDKEYMKSSADDRIGAVLLYEPGEQVEITVKAADTFVLEHLELTDESGHEQEYHWADQKVMFAMPEKI